jgi:penicillin-binding protein 2
VNAVGYVSAISEQDAKTLDASAYAGTNLIGKLGIEKEYEAFLHGSVGYRQVLVNAEGRRLQNLEQQLPVPGQDLTISLDIELQLVANVALAGRRGAVVAIDPRSGEVLVLTSTPAFDPNLFTVGISSEDYRRLQNDPDKPLFNRALRGQYPPGSTIKPIVGLAGLAYLGRDPRETHFCPGFYMLPGQSHRYRDWKKQGHGRIDFIESVAQSCDVYYYELAVELGIERMHEIMTYFGLGALTGIDVPAEKGGLLPSREWKRNAFRRRADQVWFPGETVITGIGQGYTLTTPLQLAQATAVLAASGMRFRPHLLLAQLDPVTGQITRHEPLPEPRVPVDDPVVWRELHAAMEAVMHGPTGTARASAAGASFRYGGKTGTAQVFTIAQDEEYDEEEVEERLRHHALFVAYAPAEAPEIALAIIVENGGSGSRAAAPVARQILDAYMARRGS